MPLPFFADVEFTRSMKLKRKVMAVALAIGAASSAPVAAVTNLDDAINNYLEEVEELVDEPTTPEITALEAVLDEITNPLSQVIIETEPVASVDTEPRWVLANATEAEAAVLKYFQDYGITDRAALATLLGNVKQESKFITNICEGGRRGPYHTCRRGGFGLIQWTTVGRYSGLGRHARQMGTSPEQLETQLSYLVTEVEWKKAEWRFKTPGKSIAWYMKGAFRWLGWGVHGNRTVYSQQYYDRLSLQ